MSFKTELLSNNIDLQAILEAINALPRSEDVVENLNQETWTFTLDDGSTVEKAVYVA